MSTELRLPPPHKVDPRAGELAARIYDMVHEYDGEISLASAVGALEIAKHYLLRDLAG